MLKDKDRISCKKDQLIQINYKSNLKSINFFVFKFY